MNPRLLRLIAKFSQEKIDAILLSHPVNISYLLEWESVEAWLLLTPDKCVYLTDFRYVEEMKGRLAREISLYQFKKDIFNPIYRLCRRMGIKNLGVESRGILLLDYEKLKAALGKEVRLKPTHNLVETLRQIKEPAEIEKLRQAVALTAQAFDYLKTIIQPGKSEKELALALEDFVRRQGCRLSFKPIIASGVNSSFPHARISDRKLKENEAITVDIGVDCDGYKSDLTRVFFLGRIPKLCRRIYRIAREAEEQAIKATSVGSTTFRLDSLARNYIKRKGLGRFFGHSLGHGVGLEVHELPMVSWKSNVPLEKNMVFTLEPGIYLPARFGVRVEDMVLVRDKDCEVLSGFIHKSD